MYWVAAYLLVGSFLVGMGRRACENEGPIALTDLIAAASWPMILGIMLGAKFCGWMMMRTAKNSQGIPADDCCSCGCGGHA